MNHEKTPWDVVAGHRPWYISGQNRSSMRLDCRKVFEPLFTQYNVDLVLSGHVHAYQRNKPVVDHTVDPTVDLAGLSDSKGVWYITNGAAEHCYGLETLVQPLPYYAA